MITTILTGFALILAQSWLRDFDRSSLALIGFFLVVAGYLFPRLPGRVKAVSEAPHDGEIHKVRSGTGRLAALHHVGIFFVAGVLLLQITLIIA